MLPLLLTLLLSPLHAAQTAYDVTRGANTWSFDVKWTDADGKRHNASYKLPAKAVKQDLDVPLRFKKREAAKLQAEAVREYGQTVGPKVKARATPQGAVRISVSGKKRKAVKRTLKEAKQVSQKSLDRYMKQTGFTTLKRGIIPDHTRHANEYAGDLRPLVKALGGPGANPRAFAEKALGFVQSIPYERRALVNDRYRRPLSLLGRNRGDCDSKVVLMLALMKQAWPNVDTAVVYIPGHAFAAIAIDPKPGDLRFQRDGRTWVVIEPVGPREMKVGKAGGKSRRRVRARAFQMSEV